MLAENLKAVNLTVNFHTIQEILTHNLCFLPVLLLISKIVVKNKIVSKLIDCFDACRDEISI